MRKISKIATAILAIGFTLGMGAGCEILENFEGILGNFLPGLTSSVEEDDSSSKPGDPEHECESECPRCNGCEDEACEEEACEDKCDCRAITWTVKDVDVTVRDHSGMPQIVKNRTSLQITVTPKSGYFDPVVKVNGQVVNAERNNTYRITVSADSTIEITATPESERKYYELVDATVVVRNEKPYYLLKGEHNKYTEAELKGMYFDMQNNRNYNDAYGWESKQVEFELVYTATTFEMYVDLSDFPVNTCQIPHFNGTSSEGDVKIATSDGASITVNKITYTIDFGATDWGCAVVTIMGESQNPSLPSDTTAPTMNEITNYEYFKTTQLPRIDINTENGIALDDPSLEDGWKVPDAVKAYDYTNATISVSNCEEEYQKTDVAAEVKIRGNYSSTYPKRPIRIKFNKKQPLLGLSDGNKFKNWVLLNDYKDSSMLRNSVALYLGNSILNADGLYASDFRYVEVYLNDKYNGLYLLVEQQEVKDDNRISVPEAPDPEDVGEAANTVKIGYSVEFDGYYYTEKELERFEISYDRLRWENGNYVTPGQKGFSIKSDVYYESQKAFIQKCIQNIWDIVYDATYGNHYDLTKNPYYTLNADGEMVADPTIKTPREAVEKVIDTRSLVDTFILNEICQDMDLGWSSFYMSLDMSETGDRLLKFEAPWDWDSTLGSAAADNTKLFTQNQMYHNGGSVAANPWLLVLGREAWFWSHVQAKWNALKEAGTFTGVIGMIDYYTANYVDYYKKNFERWPECIGRKIEGQQIDLIATFKTQAQASAYLKEWLTTRINNLDGLIAGKVTQYLG